MGNAARTWQPSAALATLRLRAKVLGQIREFFAERGAWEVETPVISRAASTDVHLHSLSTTVGGPPETAGRCYLHTSPEFAMKRLLAAGSGAIYQICKVFRDDECGRLHNPEFTMLEWYRPGYDHHRLMDEVDDLLQAVAAVGPAERLSYAQAFERYAGVDPYRASIDDLAAAACAAGVVVAGASGALDRDAWLDMVLSHLVGPKLGQGRPTFLYDFPASQAALARVRAGNPPVAERFELYVGGVELANGFHELTDAAEQRRRFAADLAQRAALGLASPPIDECLLAALAAGLPACAGVAMGLDRLLMWLAGAHRISEVIAFDFGRA